MWTLTQRRKRFQIDDLGQKYFKDRKYKYNHKTMLVQMLRRLQARDIKAGLQASCRMHSVRLQQGQLWSFTSSRPNAIEANRSSPGIRIVH